MNCIIIPIYYENPTRLDRFSIKSLDNNLKDINDYDVIYVCPKNTDMMKWISLMQNPNTVSSKEFDRTNFLSTTAYSKMLESFEFWNAFANYEYTMIYQTDVYCVGGILSDYIDMGYDYIGAPIIAKNARWFNTPAIGNGGASLRKTSTMIELTDGNGEFIQICKDKIDMHNRMNSDMYKVYEDLYFAQLAPMLWDVSKPKFDVAVSFAYDMNADIVYEMTNHNLPLFIHAFDKNIRFWQNIINDFKDISIISDCEWKNRNGYLSQNVGYQSNLNHIIPPKVCAVMIVKNENYHLKKQISKLLDNGIRKVILIDNNSIDGETPSDAIDSEYVEIITKYRGEHSTADTNILSESYTEAYKYYTDQYTHVLFIDADEEIDFNINEVVIENKDRQIIYLPVKDVKTNGEESNIQRGMHKTLMVTGLNIQAFSRQTPITFRDGYLDESHEILNYITCKSPEEYNANKKFRGYPDKIPSVGKTMTDDDLYDRINNP